MAANTFIKDLDTPVFISTRAACKLFEVSPQTLMDWEAGGLQKISRGKWDLKQIIEFRGLGGKGGLTGQEKSLAQRKIEAEVALKESQTDLSKLKGDILCGKFLDAELVDSELKRFFIVFKRSALNMASKISSDIASYVDAQTARRIEKDIADTVTDALTQMSVNGIFYGKTKKRN